MQGDGEVAPRRAGRDDDAVDNLTDGLGSLRGVVGMGERGGQAFDPAPVGLGDAGVHVGNVLRGVRHAGGEAFLSGLKLGEPVG